MPVVSEQHKDAMRDRLLAAAAAVIAERGYERMTVRDVLAQAGVAPNTLYAYFKGKADLVRALIERSLALYVGELSEPGDASLEELFGRVLERAMSEPLAASAILAQVRRRTESDGKSHGARRINESIAKTWAPIVERMSSSGIDDTEALVELLDIVHAGMVQRASAESFATSYARVGKVCLGLLSGSIRLSRRTQ